MDTDEYKFLLIYALPFVTLESTISTTGEAGKQLIRLSIFNIEVIYKLYVTVLSEQSITASTDKPNN